MPGSRVTTVFRGMRLEIEATYEPGYEMEIYDPGEPEHFDIGGIFGPDGVTPVALSDSQVDELEEQLLAEMHAERDYERFQAREDRGNDVDPIDRANRCP